MSSVQSSPTNPFALLLDPQQVLASIEHSGRLERLQRRVCRPLDKPAPQGKPGSSDTAPHSFDESIDPDGDESPDEL